MKKLALITLGCQMNKHDSEWIAGLLSDQYQLTENHGEADLLIVNTCTVRDKAEQKFFSLLGRLRPLKSKNKNMILGVAGCVSQDQGKTIIAREPAVDLVIGPRAIDALPIMLEELERTGEPQVNVSDTQVFDEYPMQRGGGHNAWVSIMQGCDNHCSYCIVPHTRGSERSRKPDSIITEISKLAEDGFTEITLLGQNVNSYGAKENFGVGFPRLLELVNNIDGIERLRFVTSHPKDLSDGLIEAMASLEKVCPSLHLPIQSGSDAVLKKMNRGYTCEEYFDKVDRLRNAVPKLALTADVIVGYPGEEESDFQKTVAALERAEYENIFLFKYSPRRGTPAATEINQIPAGIISDRFLRAERIQKAISHRKYKEWIGRQTTIIAEGPSKRDSSKQSGRNPQNLIVHFSSDMDYTGKMLRVSITGSSMYSLQAEVAW